MIYFINDQEIIGQFKTANGTTYPADWCIYATEDELNNLGIIVLEGVYPELISGYYYDGSYIDDFEELTRTYNMVPNLVNNSFLFTATGTTHISNIFNNDSLITTIAMKANDGDETIKVGSTENGSELASDDTFLHNTWKVISINTMAPQDIYFTGATGSVIYKIFIR